MNANSNPTYSILLNKQEIEVLLALVDLGVKAGGLQVATNAAVLHAKIQAAKVVDIIPPVSASPPTSDEIPF